MTYKCPTCAYTAEAAGNCPTCNVPLAEVAAGATEAPTTPETPAAQ